MDSEGSQESSAQGSFGRETGNGGSSLLSFVYRVDSAFIIHSTNIKSLQGAEWHGENKGSQPCPHGLAYFLIDYMRNVPP